MSDKVVGLLIGRENTFPGPFIETVNRKGASKGVRAEMAVLGGGREIKRISEALGRLTSGRVATSATNVVAKASAMSGEATPRRFTTSFGSS